MNRDMGRRPKKRTIVRWDENLNELLLLTIQSVCNSQSIKIPWADVATTMGHDTTEGAIVQHLAKLRARRIQARKAVPPPLKRGSVAAPSKGSDVPDTRRQQGSRGQPSTVDDTSDEEWVERRTSKRRNPRSKIKRRKAYYTPVPDQDLEESDGDGELLAPGAKFLDLPNDGHTVPSPSPQPIRKMVSYKCPKHFLANLENKASYGNVHHTPPMEMSAPKTELPTMDGGCYESFTNEAMLNPSAITMPAQDPRFFHKSAIHSGFAEHAIPSPPIGDQQDLKYIPTGHPDIDLPSIGLHYSQPEQDMFLAQYHFNQDHSGDHQGFQPALRFQMDHLQLNQAYHSTVEEPMLNERPLHFNESGWFAD
ncbi:hypothetical protein BJX70DRAFT_505 [Aspergillus crustosus]